MIDIDKNVNWKKIKNEYITTSISQRDLADKYNICYGTLRDRATSEKWYDLRNEANEKAVANVEQKLKEKLLYLNEQYINFVVELIKNKPDFTGTKYTEKKTVVTDDGERTTTETEWQANVYINAVKTANDIIKDKEKLQLEKEKIDNNNW